MSQKRTQRVDDLEDAILRTILYADVFNFPLTLAEIHHYLIASSPSSAFEVEQVLMRSPRLQETLVCIDGYYVRAGREALVTTRQEREAASAALWDDALRYAGWMARLPFVRMVALTGALAVRNAVEGDDIDYILVTRERRVWLARAFAIIVVRLARRRGVLLCPNYVLSETALAQSRRDIFIAHEVTQMIPLYGRALYRDMRGANAWVMAQLPNAADALYAPQDDVSVGTGWGRLKNALEAIFGGVLADKLEDWERERKLRRFAAQMRQPHNSAELDDQHVKGHFNDHGHPSLRAYQARLQEYGLNA
jgi:hypothetical protein